MAWTVGTVLQNGKYVIDRLLGSGGFSLTYLAQHRLLQCPVVLKTPKDELRQQPDYDRYLQRFLKEGQKLAQLGLDRPPHIVRVSDFFVEQGLPCLVMDYITGESLWDWVQHRGPLPETEALTYICQIGTALEIVHRAGLVHRDAHPANILIQPSGEAMLIDFGIVGETDPSVPMTRFFGNPTFAPYEQFGQPAQPRMDVYSLAATLYFAVTGQSPTPALQQKLHRDKLISPRKHNRRLSRSLNRLILKGMTLDPQARPQSIAAWLGSQPLKYAVDQPWDPTGSLVPGGQPARSGLDWSQEAAIALPPLTLPPQRLPHSALLLFLSCHSVLGLLLASLGTAGVLSALLWLAAYEVALVVGGRLTVLGTLAIALYGAAHGVDWAMAFTSTLGLGTALFLLRCQDGPLWLGAVFYGCVGGLSLLELQQATDTGAIALGTVMGFGLLVAIAIHSNFVYQQRHGFWTLCWLLGTSAVGLMVGGVSAGLLGLAGALR